MRFINGQLSMENNIEYLGRLSQSLERPMKRKDLPLNGGRSFLVQSA
jgi:hypothetical protein